MTHVEEPPLSANEETPMSTKDKNTKQLGALIRELTEAAKAQVEVALAQEKVDTLEKRALAPLALPGGRVVGVPRTGTVGLNLLARQAAASIFPRGCSIIGRELAMQSGCHQKIVTQRRVRCIIAAPHHRARQ